jgi:hypothetical protein
VWGSGGEQVEKRVMNVYVGERMYDQVKEIMLGRGEGRGARYLCDVI